MRKTFKILKMSTKDIQTKYGQKQKYNIQGQIGNAEKFWCSAWSNKETQKWCEGMEVTADITSREYEGKTYYDCAPIPLEEVILEKLNRIEELLLARNTFDKNWLEMTAGKESSAKVVTDEEPADYDEDDIPPELR